MAYFGQVKNAFLPLSLALVVLVNGQTAIEQSNKKNISLDDRSVDQTVKSALENGSVSEVIVRKDLLLFPVNAPNLVIAHTQEIHAVPQTNGTNTTDRKPSIAEVAEVNEYSLSQLVSTNDTNYDNETKSEISGITASTLLHSPQKVSVLEPGKLLEIVSGFNLSHGLATESIPLPEQVQNISIPKQSIEGLLSKSLQQSNMTLTGILPSYGLKTLQTDASITAATNMYPSLHEIANKRSVNLEECNSSDNSITLPAYPCAIRQISIDSNENENDDKSSDSENDNSDETVGTSTACGNDIEDGSIDSKTYDKDNANVENIDDRYSTVEYESTSRSSAISDIGVLGDVKMFTSSIDLQAKNADSNRFSTTEYRYYDYKVRNSFEQLDVDSATNYSISDSQPFPMINEASNRMKNDRRKLKEDFHEGMEVAESIIFRPLFRYRQETRLHQQSFAARKSGYRKSSYNVYDSEYNDRYKSDSVDY